MTSWRQRNERMVDWLVAAGIAPEPIEAAFRAVPRHLFLPGVALDRVYTAADAILTRQTREGVGTSSSSAPQIMAVMLQALDLQPGHRVLEIGAGTGYNAAVMAHIVGPAGRVVSIDLAADVAAEASDNLHAIGIGGGRVEVRVGDGWDGAPDAAPFDRVVSTVGVTDIAPAWRHQLSPDGRLVVPLWLRPGVEVVAAFARTGATLTARNPVRCGFMRLRGEHSGGEEHVAVDAPWSAAIEAPDGADVVALRSLHEALVDVGRAPSLPDGWYERLALEGERVVHTWMWRGKERGSRQGLFDPSAPGLAMVEGDRLKAAGEASVLTRLRTLLAGIEPLPFADLEIIAVPNGEVTGIEVAQWVVPRPACNFLVRVVGDP